MARTYSAHTIAAARLLGTEIAAARRRRRWTSEALAERAGITRPTLRRIEIGEPSVAIGTVFEVATLVGVRLFDADERSIDELVLRAEERLRLLPSHVYDTNTEVDDDF